MFEPHLHCDVSSIQNPLGRTYTVTYQPDQSSKVMFGPFGFYLVPGLPRVVSQVNLPDGVSSTIFENHSFIAVIPNGDYVGVLFYGHKANYVRDALGNGRLYQFTAPNLTVLSDFMPYLANREVLDPLHTPEIVLFQNEIITSFSNGNVTFADDTNNENNFSYTPGAGTVAMGTESFAFDLSAGMAPATATDMSGHTTTFAYGDTWDFTGNYPFLTGKKYMFGKYADPTSQTDANNQIKFFTYFMAPAPGTFEPRARRMTQIIDEAGRKTMYTLDDYGNRTSEKIYDVSGTLVQQTDFVYGNARFPGFVTKRIVRAVGN